MVAFYEGDAHLADVVGTFAGAGLTSGDAMIIVATGEHLRAVDEQLAAAGIDTDAVEGAGRLVTLDAADTLARFMVDGVVDRDAFRAVIGGIVGEAIRRSGRVRIYGEMVALLWEDGQVEAAIELEDAWNELATVEPFVLLCAYPMRAFERDLKTDSFRTMCGKHAAVLPHEGFGIGGAGLAALLLERTHARGPDEQARVEATHGAFVNAVVDDLRGRMLQRGDDLLVDARRTLADLDALTQPPA